MFILFYYYFFCHPHFSFFFLLTFFVIRIFFSIRIFLSALSHPHPPSAGIRSAFYRHPLNTDIMAFSGVSGSMEEGFFTKTPILKNCPPPQKSSCRTCAEACHSPFKLPHSALSSCVWEATTLTFLCGLVSLALRFHSDVMCSCHVVMWLRSTADNSNLQGKSKKVRVIGSSKNYPQKICNFHM